RLGGRGGRLVEPDGRGRVVVGDRGRVLLGRAHGGVVRVGQLDLHGLVELVQRVVHDRGRDVLGGVARCEGQRARGQGVVHAAAGGAAAGHGVVDLDRLARGRVQRHLEGARADRLGGRGGRLVEPDGRGRVVVGDRGRVLLGRAQGGVVRVGQLDLHGLVELVQRVVHERGRDVLGGVTRGEGQRARGHGVVHAAAGGVA